MKFVLCVYFWFPIEILSLDLPNTSSASPSLIANAISLKKHPNLVKLVLIISPSEFDFLPLKVKHKVPDSPSMRLGFCSSSSLRVFGGRQEGQSRPQHYSYSVTSHSPHVLSQIKLTFIFLFHPTCDQRFHSAVDVQERSVRPVCPGHTQLVPAQRAQLDLTAAPLRPRQPDHQVATPPLQAQLSTLLARVMVHEGSPLAGGTILNQVIHWRGRGGKRVFEIGVSQLGVCGPKVVHDVITSVPWK